MVHFLFPADPLNPRLPDDLFQEQLSALETVGFSCSLCPDEALIGGGRLKGLPANASVVYRGWMLKPTEYEGLCQRIEEAGAIPFTPPQAYQAAHYLPHWYPLIRELTPETHVFSLEGDLEKSLEELGWEAFFVKDYVKSLKTSGGSIIHKPSEIRQVLAEMEKFRGEIEGGLCVRRVEDFLPETERRYFVLKGRAFASDPSQEIPEIVHTCAEMICSRFFSVDVIERKDGVLRVVEVGDGQVSDLVGWTPSRFAQIWSD